MKKFALQTLMILLFSNFSNAQTTTRFVNLWEQVHQFELESLPKSALKIVEKIYKKATEDNNAVQITKAIIYKSKFALLLEENAQLKIIEQLKNEIKLAQSPSKNILENILAKWYWQYYEQNRYRFYQRTKTQKKVDVVDFRTWDLQTLYTEVHTHYQKSLDNTKLLANTSLKQYSKLLNNIKNSQLFRPSLLDFLAHNALEFYAQTELNITKPAYKFELNTILFFDKADAFTKQNITTKDTLSLQFNSLLIYQTLIKNHLKKNNTTALAKVDVERLNFVKQHTTVSNKEALLEETLHLAYHKNEKYEASGLYAHALANLYHQQAQQYNPKSKKPIHQFKNKEALQLCNNIINKFPNSFSAKHCQQLKTQIENPSLSIILEEIIPLNQKSKLLINYKGFDELHFKAYKITKKQRQKFHTIYNDSSKVVFIRKLKSVRQWKQTLKTENDYQKHTTEVIVPEFDNGNYIIVASEGHILHKDKLFATAFVQASNLALIEKSANGKIIYQVVDRNTGKPIEKAKITLRNYKEIRGRYEKAYNKTFTSNRKGEFSIQTNRYYRNLEATVVYQEDTAVFNGYYIYQNRGHRGAYKTQEVTFLFTDRSIYRPGQTVYFKGISLDKQQNKSSVATNKKMTVVLTDVNGQEVSTQNFTTNAFGSFAGEFILPNGGLTGNFNIRVNSYNNYFGNVNFSVEEYKRPKFEATFKPVTQTFKINDSVQVTGEAKAYAGSVISDAKVVYRVHRKVNYPRWWYWYRPQYTSEAQEIAHGETTTDAKGNFNITFKALADTSTDKKDLPVFTYEVTADITDINGETRSAITNIKVGYHTTLANVSISEKIEKENKENTFEITTTNLNGEKVDSKGSVKIYKLQAPKFVLRKRPWEAPDYQIIPQTIYEQHFKHDAYKDEDNILNWKKGALVFDTSFDTSKKTKHHLKRTKKWISGKYLIIAETKDKNGMLVKDEQRFEVFSKTAKTVADMQLLTVTTNKETYQPNEQVELRIGSAAKDLYVTITVEKAHLIVHTEILHLNNSIKMLKIPVTKEDLGGFAVHYQSVGYNAFVNGNLRIAVPYPATDLQIEASTFRDKLQPNQQETWTFNIKGPKGEKVTSEVLASMYDASLDAFKPHNWRFNPINHSYYYPSIGSNANHSISNTYFGINNLPYKNYYTPRQYFDSYNWFGFHMYNQWINNQYLSTLKMVRKHYDFIITGNIADNEGPLPGVNVVIKGTRFGTTTDFDGNYSIKVKKGETLQFSFVGYETIEKKVTTSNVVNIILEAGDAGLDEVVVTALSGKVAGLKIRGARSMNKSAPAPMVSEEAIEMEMGAGDANGITDKADKKDSEEKAKKVDFLDVKIRKNLQETAFFFPKLQTDSKGDISFSFTTPEALTRWNLNLLAHTKEGFSAQKSLQTVTQKELMVLPNAPRFLRESDTIVIASKIANLTNKPLSGYAALQLTDAITGKPVDTQLQNANSTQSFAVDAKGNTNVNWQLVIPNGMQAVQYKIVAKAGDFSDGEQNALPVLSNRMLVTETLPMWIRSNQTKTFTLDKLKNNTSSTLTNHRLTLEMTSNPAWYAVQALPYLMEYPYECAEQTFSRFYANSLASHIANSNPRIQEVFNQWKNTDALLSNLEKNQELKSLIIQETPWLRDAQSETQQKKRIGLLFDLNHMSNNLQSALHKLNQMQMSSGAWPWFKGSRYPNRYITQHIATSFGHLNKLNVLVDDKATRMIVKAVSFLDEELIHDYQKLLKQARKIKERAKTKAKGLAAEKAFLAQDHTSYFQLQFLYMRSFYKDKRISNKLQKAMDYYTAQSQEFWLKRNLYAKGMIALIHYRNGNTNFASAVLKSLKENSISSEELGMYWKSNTPSWYWYQAPIETQALMIEVFSEIKLESFSSYNPIYDIDNLKVWLLKNKQTNRWKTTKATTEAVYALLLQGSEWLDISEQVEVSLGNKKIEPSKLENVKTEAGTGYYKIAWNGNEIKPEMASVTISKKDKGIAWGGLYWQYFEDLDKITSAETPLKLKKKLFLKSNSDTGKELTEIKENTKLKLGDLITVRIELRCDRQMEFIHLKDTRAAGLEPINVLSQYKWQDGLGYYESTKDASTNFFISHLPKGIYVFEYDVRVNNSGNFSNGITTIQSMYAPEFSSHSEGIRINVE